MPEFPAGEDININYLTNDLDLCKKCTFTNRIVRTWTIDSSSSGVSTSGLYTTRSTTYSSCSTSDPTANADPLTFSVSPRRGTTATQSVSAVFVRWDIASSNDHAHVHRKPSTR